MIGRSEGSKGRSEARGPATTASAAQPVGWECGLSPRDRPIC